jgi:Holliday junction resolvase RusA-like endonuclease
MPRQRTPLEEPAVFEYLVIGRPASAHSRSAVRPRRDSSLQRWRNAIQAAIEQALFGKKYEVQIDPMRVQIVWFADKLEDESGPDLDNITKPFLDRLEGIIVNDDRIFHEVHLRKVDLNHQFDPEPPLVLDARASEAREFVYVRVERLEWDRPTRLERVDGASR